MGFSRRFSGGYGWPALLLAADLALLAWLLPHPGLAATKLLVALIAAAMVWRLWERTRRTNLALARFVASLGQGDLAQMFGRRGRGGGFDELAAAFDEAMGRLRRERLASAAENRFSAALADEAPTPLLAVSPDGIVSLANKAARRLFRHSDGRHAREFARYGGALADALLTTAPGTRRTIRVLWDGLPQRALLAASTVERQGQPWRIVSIQIIQRELDAAEIATQADLVRVLTHEIMNSITPVTSLAISAAALMDAAEQGDAAAGADARRAVETLSRRAESISHFVETYRAFSHSPSIAPSRYAVAPWIEELARSFAATPQAEGVAVVVSVEPETLTMNADADLLGQVVLNLLKNAGEAARAHAAAPRVTLSVERSQSARVRITVTDNGPGVAKELVHDIFLPFFTTKPSGTGVGLSFARQIVLLHGGDLSLRPRADGESRFEILL